MSKLKSFLKSILFVLGISMILDADAQIQPVPFDTIYNKDIATLKFHAAESPLAIASVPMHGSLILQFDDLRSGNRRYRYEIIHCDRNWKKDELNEYEYIHGFNRSLIKDFSFSTNRNQDYTFYSLTIPNNDCSLKVSGNYLIHIYEDLGKGNRDYIFTRRFMLYDQKISIEPNFVRPSDISKYRTNQEIDIEVFIKEFPIYQSRNEIFLSVMQNGRWNTLISNLTQNRDKTDYLVFDYIDKISFEAGKEFRFFDIRSLNFRSRFVKKITKNTDETIVTLNIDKVRTEFNFVNERDANGNYVIGNSDLPNSDFNISSEYAWVDFTLQSPEFDQNKVFLIGSFSDWQCKEENLMKYDLATQSYLGSVYLKQGYYNYAYAVMDRQGHFDISTVDGDFYETENDYQFMVYYRPFGTRYDQLISYLQVKSTYRKD